MGVGAGIYVDYEWWKFPFGRAQISFIGGGVAQLADIIIRDSEYYPCKYLPFYKKKIRYTRRGYGTRLLDEVVSRCKSRGIIETAGEIHGDINVLTRWYKNNGFEVINEKEIRCKFGSHSK
mgnify:CR=1 FL=1